MLPPKIFWASGMRRVSAMIWMASSLTSVLMTGSRLAMASIWPERMAVIAPAPAPTPMNDTSEGLRPVLGQEEADHHVG